MSELLPCAHCGGEGKVWTDGLSHGVWCVECGSGIEMQGKPEARVIAAWNRRPFPGIEEVLRLKVEEQKARILSLEAALKDFHCDAECRAGEHGESMELCPGHLALPPRPAEGEKPAEGIVTSWSAALQTDVSAGTSQPPAPAREGEARP